MADKLHIWKARELATALRDNEISEKTIVLHFIIYSIIFSGVAFIPFGPKVDLPDASSSLIAQGILELGLSAIIVYYGTWYTYQINTKGDGQHFFRRFFALTLPISARLLVFGGALFLALSSSLVAIANFLSIPSFADGALSSLGSIAQIAWSLAFYFAMGIYMRVASGNEAS